MQLKQKQVIERLLRHSNSLKPVLDATTQRRALLRSRKSFRMNACKKCFPRNDLNPPRINSCKKYGGSCDARPVKVPAARSATSNFFSTFVFYALGVIRCPAAAQLGTPRSRPASNHVGKNRDPL